MKPATESRPEERSTGCVTNLTKKFEVHGAEPRIAGPTGDAKPGRRCAEFLWPRWGTLVRKAHTYQVRGFQTRICSRREHLTAELRTRSGNCRAHSLASAEDGAKRSRR